MIEAPWSSETVRLLRYMQSRSDFHPYTCENGHNLTPTPNGWVCSRCPEYKQKWVWEGTLTLARNLQKTDQEVEPVGAVIDGGDGQHPWNADIIYLHLKKDGRRDG